MAKNLERYDKLVIVGCLIAVLVLGVGYWFAQEKSEPVYLSKIDRLMFDKNNKSPAYILTLPDKIEISSQTQDEAGNNSEKQNVAKNEIHENENFSLENLIGNVPNIGKLPNKNGFVPMKNVGVLPELIEIKENGSILPKKGNEGHRAWIEYGNTINTLPNFKKIAVVIGNLGFDNMAVNKIASAFSSGLSMSFHPYMTHDVDNISTARQKGHETYMDVLLASKDFLREDTGPLAINFDLTKEELFARLHKIISKKEPIGGIIIRDGKISSDKQELVKSILEEIRDRGLLMIDATSSDVINTIKVDSLARRRADIVINKDTTPEEIDDEIKKAENIAFDKGQVLIVADDKPLIIVKLAQWIDTFSPQLSYEEAKTVDITKPFALVPVSNLVVE